MAMGTLMRSKTSLWRFHAVKSSEVGVGMKMCFCDLCNNVGNALVSILLCGVCCLFFGLLTACSSNSAAPLNNVWDEVNTTQTRYTVQAGDTLYTIAWRFNVSDEQLARWNNLHKPYALHVGQTLRLAASPSSAEVIAPHIADAAQPIAAAPSFTPVKSQSGVSSAQQSKSVAEDHTATDHTLHATDAAPTAVDAHGKGTWPWPATGPLLATYGQSGNKGIDIALPMGAQVKAVQAGTVVYSGANLHDYGRLLIVKQKNDLITAYAHNSKLLVAEGDHVTQGQVIALSGDSEAAKPMLHFEVRKLGKTVDPLQYLN